MAMCAEILIRRKWGSTRSPLFLCEFLYRWTLAACLVFVWHAEVENTGEDKGGMKKKRGKRGCSIRLLHGNGVEAEARARW